MVEWPCGAAEGSTSDRMAMPMNGSRDTWTAGLISGTMSTPRWTAKVEQAGSATTIRAEVLKQVSRPDELEEGTLDVGIRDHGFGGNLPAVGAHEARRAAVLDRDPQRRGSRAAPRRRVP